MKSVFNFVNIIYNTILFEIVYKYSSKIFLISGLFGK